MLSIRFKRRQLVASFIISGGTRRCQGQYHRQFFRRVCTRQRRKIWVSTIFGMWWFPMAFLPLFRRICLSRCRRKSRKIRKPPPVITCPSDFVYCFLGIIGRFFLGMCQKEGLERGSNGCAISPFFIPAPRVSPIGRPGLLLCRNALAFPGEMGDNKKIIPIFSFGCEFFPSESVY